MAYCGPQILVADVVLWPSRSIIKQSYDARLGGFQRWWQLRCLARADHCTQPPHHISAPDHHLCPARAGSG